jgi:hypothetical protein
VVHCRCRPVVKILSETGGSIIFKKQKQDMLTYLMFPSRKKTFDQKTPEANKILKLFYGAYMVLTLHFVKQKTENFNPNPHCF